MRTLLAAAMPTLALALLLGPAAPPAVPLLVDLLYGEADAPAKAAIRALGRIGHDAREARPFLADTARLRAPQPTRPTPSRMGTQAVRVLAELLEHEDAGARKDAAWAPRTMGARARPAVPDLVAALKAPEAFVVAQAAWALGQIGPAAAETLPALEKLYAAHRYRAIVADAMRRTRGEAK